MDSEGERISSDNSSGEDKKLKFSENNEIYIKSSKSNKLIVSDHENKKENTYNEKE